MKRAGSISNILMELKKVCQHPYLVDPSLENLDLSPEEQQKRLTDASGKLLFLKKLLPSLKARGRRVLLFSQFKIALDRIEDFLIGEGYKYLRLDGDVSQVRRQKDMDKFNADNSDYFIFLLTTRAGGVGINLATADTVVVHDPDFNPHQDLQAIARSHRYGQKKAVLVFKLMSENAVESRIMANGKKKLVLDHLVVQKMGQETEEGELDDLLLYGAEAISKADDAAQDRVWTTQKVEELIDGAEKEAVEEAKRLEEREKEKEREKAEGKTGTKEAMGFSFAKVWETNEGKLRDEADQNDSEEPQDFDQNSWLAFIENADKELERQQAEELAAQTSKGRLRRKTQPKSYVIDDEPDTPKKGRPKGKGKAKDDNSDNEFVAPTQDEESEDEVSDEIDFSDLNYDERRSLGGVLAGKLAGKQKLTKHEKELLRAHKQGRRLAAQQAMAADGIAGPGPSTFAQAAGGGADDMMRRMQNVAEYPPSQVPLPLTQQGALLVPNGAAITAQPPSAPPSNPARAALHSRKMLTARQLLRNLISELVASPFTKNKDTLRRIWHSMTEVGGPLEHRELLYRHLGKLADHLRTSNGREPLYLLLDAAQLVKYFFITNESIWDAAEIEERRRNDDAQLAAARLKKQQEEFAAAAQHQLARQAVHDERIERLAALQQQAVAMQQHQIQHSYSVAPKPAGPSGQPRVVPSTIQPAPRPGPRLVLVPHPERQPQPAAPPADVPLQMPQPQYAAGANPLRQGAKVLAQNGAQDDGSQVIDRPQANGQPQSNGSDYPDAYRLEKPDPTEPEVFDLLDDDDDERPPPATLPSRPQSSGSTGPAPSRKSISLSGSNRPSTASSGQTPSALQLGDSSRFDINAPSKDEDECYWCNEHHALRDCPNLVPEEDLENFRQAIEQGDESPEDKQKGLDAIQKMLAAHRERKKPSRRPSSRASNKSRDAPGSKRRPIDLDATDEDEPAHSVKRPRPSDVERAEEEDYQPFQGCTICHNEVYHSTSQCPVVKAGPVSIEEALKRFTPSDAVYAVLKQILRVLQMGRSTASTCPYCGLRCGQTVRACAEERGTRKDLKEKIRGLEDQMTRYNARIDQNREQLRALGRTGAGTPEQTQADVLIREINEITGQIEQVREVIDPLYKAYLEWPKEDSRPSNN